VSTGTVCDHVPYASEIKKNPSDPTNILYSLLVTLYDFKVLAKPLTVEKEKNSNKLNDK
jgi:hypothetical protein